MVSERVTALVLVGLAVASAALGWLILPGLTLAVAVAGALVQTAATVAQLRWRTAIGPVLTLTVVTVAAAYLPSGWQQAFEVDLIAWIPVSAAYATVRLIRDARSRTGLALGGGLLAVWLVIMIINQPIDLLNVLGAAAPPLAGACLELWRRLRIARRERLASLARERELSADRRAAEERMRIAGELHDLITHQMVRVVFQARTLADQDQHRYVRGSATEIADTATTVLTQLRDFLRTGNETGADSDPRPTRVLADLSAAIDQLAGQERRAGREVTTDLLPGAEQQLTGSSYRCLVRAVEEGLANAGKHAPRVAVRITTAIEDDQLVLAIENDLDRSPERHRLADTGSGAGLRGLASRAELIGGSLRTSSADGLFRLELRVPLVRAATDDQGRSARLQRA